MKESFDNTWKQKMDDPEAFGDFIPKDVRNRIEKKLFPSRKTLWWRASLSHAAALLLGILATWILVTNKNGNEREHSTEDNIALQRARPEEVVLPDTAQTDKKQEYIPEKSVVKDPRKQAGRVNSAPTKFQHWSATPNEGQQAIVQHRPGGKDSPSGNRNNPEEEVPIPQEPEQQIAASYPKKKTVIPVSDIAPVSSSMTFIERIAQPVSPQTASKTQSSPFKIFNR